MKFIVVLLAICSVGLCFERPPLLKFRPTLEQMQISRSAVERHPDNALPASFDARDKWGNFIGAIRTQGKCGSCYAFGAIEAFSDRIAIERRQPNVPLSGQWVVGCDVLDGGCNGGDVSNVWQFMQYKGIPAETCYPYVSGKTPSTPRVCPATCADKSTPELYYASAVKGMPVDAPTIQYEILQRGPVEACFSVYSDFDSYKAGTVYKHSATATNEGGHCIKMIGWGEQKGEPYWLIANSWGATWGLNGTFMIARGTNECGIEDSVVAGMMNPKNKPPASLSPDTSLDLEWTASGTFTFEVNMPGYDQKSLQTMEIIVSTQENRLLSRYYRNPAVTNGESLADYNTGYTYSTSTLANLTTCETDQGTEGALPWPIPVLGAKLGDSGFKFTGWVMKNKAIVGHWIKDLSSAEVSKANAKANAGPNGAGTMELYTSALTGPNTVSLISSVLTTHDGPTVNLIQYFDVLTLNQDANALDLVVPDICNQ